MATTPQDHKTKAKPFTFTGKDGKVYKLPLASKGAPEISGRAMRDAVMDAEMGEMKLGFALLEACGAAPEAVDALYDMRSAEMLEVIGAWLQHGDGDGASLGKSSSSST